MKITEYPKSKLDYFTIEDNGCLIKITKDNHSIVSRDVSLFPSSGCSVILEVHLKFFHGLNITLHNEDAEKFLESISKL